MVIISDPFIVTTLKSMPPCQHVRLLSDTETAQLWVSHLLLFPSGVLTLVWFNLVGGLGPLPALLPIADPSETTMLAMLESPMFPHPLSLMGAADPVPAVALSPSWNGKANDAPQRREDRDRPATSFPTLQKAQAQLQGQQQHLAVGICWGCTGTTTTSQQHFAVPCVYTKKSVQICPVRSWVRPRTADGRWMAEKNSYLQAGCKPSGTTDFLVLNTLLKAREREKQAEELHPCSFHAARLQLHNVVQKEGSVTSPYRSFLLYKIRRFFSPL